MRRGTDEHRNSRSRPGLAARGLARRCVAARVPRPCRGQAPSDPELQAGDEHRGDHRRLRLDGRVTDPRKFRIVAAQRVRQPAAEQRQDPRRRRVRHDAERHCSRPARFRRDHPGHAGVVPARCDADNGGTDYERGVRRGHAAQRRGQREDLPHATAPRTQYPTTHLSNPKIKTYVVGLGDFAASSTAERR